MPPETSRTYHDPLHGAIALDRRDPTEALLIELIDTPAFQRLRRIRQLGPASLTFHGAEGSRFTHSLGVMAIARRAFDRITRAYLELQPHRTVVLCAALLHDLGHGPFSHTSEEIFGHHHEHWTARILLESPPVRDRLDAFDRGLAPALIQVYQKQYPVPLVWQLVSSQLDCDRLDYLMRDSYFSGASYGHLDLDRILMALSYDPVSQQLVVAPKGIVAIEHYLLVRHFMYTQVYNHPKNVVATWVMEQALRRARSLLEQGTWADDILRAWLTQDCDRLPLATYLGGDDTLLLYHFQRWQADPDPILSDLCRRFLDRDLPKAANVTDLSSQQRQTLLQVLARSLQTFGLPSEYYLGLRETVSRGYTLYQRGIKVQTVQGLTEISTGSPLLQTLIDSQPRTWLLYPRALEALVKSHLRAIAPHSPTA